MGAGRDGRVLVAVRVRGGTAAGLLCTWGQIQARASAPCLSPNPTHTQQGPQDVEPGSSPAYRVSRWVHAPLWWIPGWIFHAPSHVHAPDPVPAQTPTILTVWSSAWGLLKPNRKAVKGLQTTRFPTGEHSLPFTSLCLQSR